MEYIKKFDEFIDDQNYETMDELLNTVYTDEMLLEMANISQSTTGLDVIVWVQTNNTQFHSEKENVPNLNSRHCSDPLRHVCSNSFGHTNIANF